MTQHTPGRWSVAIGSEKTVIAPHVLANRRTNVVVEAKTEGDARLIAAAPAMLAALRLAERYLAHPDVQAMPFALPASAPLERIHAILDAIDPHTNPGEDHDRTA